MRIGVDARILCHPLAGIGRVIVEVGERLAKINPNIIFYAPRRPSIECALTVKNFCGVEFNAKIAEQMWFHTLLPYAAVQDSVDVFWAPAHRLPYFLPNSIAQVLTIHDLVWVNQPMTMNPLGHLLEKIHMPYSITKADRVMAISHSTKLELLEKFPEAVSKLSVIKLGHTSLSLKPGLQTLVRFGIARQYILFVGTLEPRKNLNRLIEAYARLTPVLKRQYDLVIVGRHGWGSLELDKLINSKGLSGVIKILNCVSDEELASLYQHAIFLAMPSLHEGFGLPILEAMSAGIPVLTSNCSSMPEISGDAALLVDPYSINSISHGMERLLLDAQLRLVLASNAKRNILRYSWDDCAKDLMGLFEEAVILRKFKKP